MPADPSAPGLRGGRRLTILQRDRAADDRRGYDVSLLHQPPRAARQVLLDCWQLRSDALLIEDNDIRRIAGAEQPAIRS